MSVIKQMFVTVRRGVLVAFVVLIGSLAVAAPSQANVPVYEFQPIKLIVHDVEDWGWWACDQPLMSYAGSDAWSSSKACNGDTFYDLPRKRFTGSSMRIDLWERDGTTKLLLGTTYVSSGALNEELTRNFGSYSQGYWYELLYKVVQVS